MGDIKRQINSITDLKRDSTNVNFVYRGATLVWQRLIAVAKWKTSGLNTVLNATSSNKYITSGLNINFK